MLSAESFCQPVPEPASGLRDSQTHNKNIVKRNRGVKLDLTGQDWTLRFKPPQFGSMGHVPSLLWSVSESHLGHKHC